MEVEVLGERFLINREQMVATDRRRNATREALSALRKRHDERKAWVVSSSISFRRYDTQEAVAALEQGAAAAAAAAAHARTKRQLTSMLPASHTAAVCMHCRGGAAGGGDGRAARGAEAPRRAAGRQGCHA